MSARHGEPRAFYVSVRHSRGATILALGPFATHRRALGLVHSARMLIGFRAKLDPWCEYGYGTCSLPVSEAREGVLNALLNVGADRVAPAVLPSQILPAPVMARLRESGLEDLKQSD